MTLKTRHELFDTAKDCLQLMRKAGLKDFDSYYFRELELLVIKLSGSDTNKRVRYIPKIDQYIYPLDALSAQEKALTANIISLYKIALSDHDHSYFTFYTTENYMVLNNSLEDDKDYPVRMAIAKDSMNKTE